MCGSAGNVIVTHDGRDLVGRRRRRSRASRAGSCARVLERVEDAAKATIGPSGVEREGERGDDPEVAAAAAERPEQVGVRVGRRRAHLAVGAHDLRLDDVVARQAVLAAQPAVAAAERQARDAGVGDDAAGRGETEGLRLAVDVGPERAALDVRDASLGVDVRRRSSARGRSACRRRVRTGRRPSGRRRAPRPAGRARGRS